MGDRDCWIYARQLEERIALIEAVLDTAEHNTGCPAVHWRMGQPCECWKSRLQELGNNSMNEYRISQTNDIKIEQEPSVGGDGLVHLTIRGGEPLVLCQQEIEDLKAAVDSFLKSAE